MAQGSVQRTPNGRWRARWRTPSGTHRSKTFTRQRDAERFVNRELVELEQGKAGFADSKGTVSSLIPPWWTGKKPHLKPRTAEQYDYCCRIIEARIGTIQLADLDKDRIQGFVNDLNTRYEPNTVKAIWNVLSLILQNGVDRNKLRPVKAPSLPRVGATNLTIPTRDEVEALANVIDARVSAAIILAGYCGLRQGEVLALHARDVNLTDGWVFIHQAKNHTTRALESTKTDKARRVHLPTRVKTALATHIAEYPGDELFPFSAGEINVMWRHARKTIGVESVRFHDLRHCAASLMIHAGWNVAQVSRQLGHASAAFTLTTYTHLWPDSYEDAMRRFDEYVAHEAT